VFCNDGRVVDEKERDGDDDEHNVEDTSGYERSGVQLCLIGLGRPRIGVITRLIGTGTCCIGDGRLTGTQNPLKSQFLMMISTITSLLSLSRPQLYHHLTTQS